MTFQSPNQQCQSTEGKSLLLITTIKSYENNGAEGAYFMKVAATAKRLHKPINSRHKVRPCYVHQSREPWLRQKICSVRFIHQGAGSTELIHQVGLAAPVEWKVQFVV